MTRLDEWRRIRKVIPHDEVIPVAFGEFPLDEMPPGEAKIVSLIDDDRTIRDLCMQAHANEFLVSQVVFQQYSEGRVKVVKPREIQLGRLQDRPIDGHLISGAGSARRTDRKLGLAALLCQPQSRNR